MLLVFIGYAAGRVVSAQPALEKPRQLADTISYLRISRQPILDPSFWGSTRPLVFPLLLKLSGQDIRRTSAAQLGFSIFAWGLLALFVARQLRKPAPQPTLASTEPGDPMGPAARPEGKAREFIHRLRTAGGLQLVAFGLILAFSLDRHITGWDFVMMSESLSLSFLALFIALGFWVLEGWQIGKVALLCAAGLLLAFTRDTNAFLLLMLAGLLALAVLLRWIRPHALILACAFTITFFLSNANANLGQRWVFPLGNLIGQRVLPSGRAVSFFVRCGMPVSPALMHLAGKFANADDRFLYEDPGLADFRTWLLGSGKSCYTRWLISDPFPRLGEMFAQFEELIVFQDVDKYFARGFNPLIPVRLGRLYYPEKFALAIWAITTLAALAAIWKRWWLVNPLWAAFIFLTLLLLPHLFLTWHGDAMAPERHALSVGVQLYLSFWMLVLLALDWAITRTLESRTRQGSPWQAGRNSNGQSSEIIGNVRPSNE